MELKAKVNGIGSSVSAYQPSKPVQRDVAGTAVDREDIKVGVQETQTGSLHRKR